MPKICNGLRTYNNLVVRTVTVRKYTPKLMHWLHKVIAVLLSPRQIAIRFVRPSTLLYIRRLLVPPVTSTAACFMSQQLEGGSFDRSELENRRWIDMWDGGLLPGQAFDACAASPLLLQYIAENKIPHGKALVPGCGRGYDVTALADEHRYVLGLDIAPKAVEAARDRLVVLSSDECKYKPNAHFATTSFFDLQEKDGLYDFIYDYTFLCALHPSVRPMWALKMSRLVRADGVLLTLIFPIREIDDVGPPYAVSLDLVRQVRT